MRGLKVRKSTTSAAAQNFVPVARRRRQSYPFFFHMGPVTLCITSVVLVGLMSVLYLSQVGQAVSANQQLQDINVQRAALQRQDQDLVQVIAQEQSPAYIADFARKLGLVLADPQMVQVLIVKHLLPFSGSDQTFQP